ncbi:hypothetical protein VT03_06005 [Planctomyces sp. SH-PL14]|nr:hypothetical protein VT03_06005 [Planctomyces sp. SH-PL14]
MNGLRPLEEPCGELPGLQQPQDPLEGVVRRDADGQFEKRPEPLFAMPAEQLQVRPVVGPAGDAQNRDREDVIEDEDLLRWLPPC